MSYLGTIGHPMTEPGLQELLKVIYMLQVIVHILSGKAVTRNVRRHLRVGPGLPALLASTFDIALLSIVSEEKDPATTTPGKTISAPDGEEMEGDNTSSKERDDI